MELSQALMDEELMMQAELIATILEVPVEYVIRRVLLEGIYATWRTATTPLAVLLVSCYLMFVVEAFSTLSLPHH